jgi:hypothetical protein
LKLWDKFLVVRRDGTVPDWPYLVMGARDPHAPAAIRAYAEAAGDTGEDPGYVSDLLRLADSFEEYARMYGYGDPAAGPHRTDDPATVERMKAGSTPDGWKPR